MEENLIYIDNNDEIVAERWQLAVERIAEFPGALADPAVRNYFAGIRGLTLLCDEVLKGAKRNAALNEKLFGELKEEQYQSSWLNPDYCRKNLGPEKYAVLCVWYAEFRGLIPFVFENRLKDAAAILETSIQLYNLFEESQEEADPKQETALAEGLTDIVYCYLFDYAEEFIGDYVYNDQCNTDSFAKKIVMEADLSDTGEDSYLYRFGEWITPEELGTARLLSELPEETIREMARSYTDGYIRGFALTGKDISLKSTVMCYLPLGFERFMREAVRQFEAAGLQVVINRYPVHLINKKMKFNVKPGFYGASDRQCDYDHKEDLCLFWGNKLEAHKLECLRNACEENREALAKLSGHACVEVFGRKAEDVITKESAPHFSSHQLDVNRDYSFKSHEISSRYVKDEETSFTIIAWPTPSIAEALSAGSAAEEFTENYRRIFEKLVEINTVPTDRWQQIQQRMIDVLDRADHAEIRGKGTNETVLSVQLHTLADPEKETNFENCLSDVNIPAGEVFTSPLLKGTNGILNVGYVYIGGSLFRNLRIRFENGRVADYACDNYADPEEGKKLIRKVIFGDREKLPMGEFAIGTNTAAYAAAKLFRIEDKMPVLIAEKTGPHFAVGDTCYSHEEDIATFNPDGKRIIARENECSALRNTDPENAYFSVHTDITLPYEELGSVTAVNGSERVDIIRDGRFVLEGTEELNNALGEL